MSRSTRPTLAAPACRGLRPRAAGAALLAAALFFLPLSLYAQGRSAAKTAPPAAAHGPADYTSRNFLLHTDLPPAEAGELLGRLETMLRLISEYWGRPLRGVIECYVVADLANWPAGSIPSSEGLAKIRQGAGLTVTQKVSQGRNFSAKAVVYAVADRGTPQHEAVHAYCGQTFGTTGPLWYSEGMAEMGNYWREDDRSVNCHPAVVEYLRSSPPKSLNDIVNAQEFTGDSWQNYAWRWALCHLLAHNPNYADRFRPLGLGFLDEQDVSFEQVYGAMAQEISFEYLFFLQHVALGYRVDLCSWDWKKRFVSLRGSSGVTAKVAAGRGWQPSGALVTQQERYEYRASGKWQTAADTPAVDAQGDASGVGRLLGVVLADFQLSEPFELGVEGQFSPPASGKLYLRCQDAWNEIADNTGKLSVRIRPARASQSRRTQSKAAENLP